MNLFWKAFKKTGIIYLLIFLIDLLVYLFEGSNSYHAPPLSIGILWLSAFVAAFMALLSFFKIIEVLIEQTKDYSSVGSFSTHIIFITLILLITYSIFHR